ncbi:MAG: phosphonate C-P lyase system protein PhnH [Pseudorhodobacter sp.]|nr:phosphonate C-P lyase system protein PhnH [Pseudorhodobacter sp.]
MTAASLSGGFADAPVQSARAFRAVLEAMARPGLIAPVEGAAPPAPLSVAAGVALLTLADSTTPLYLAGAADCTAVRDWIAFHIGAPLVAAEAADFALGAWDNLHPVSRFRIGAPDYPDRSATLIVEVAEMEASGPRLTGPGIRDAARLSLPETAAFRANRALFPLGFDTLFTCGNRIAGLPRSTIVEEI